jgi:hypothetical protein
MKYGPCTGGELARSMQEDKNKTITVSDWLTARAVRARLGELRDRGTVRELDPRDCKVTGRRVIVWEITGDLPTKPHKRKKNRQVEKLKARVAELEARETSLLEEIKLLRKFYWGERPQGDLFAGDLVPEGI